MTATPAVPGRVSSDAAHVRPVAVVMLTWNALAFTKRCIADVRAKTDHPAWRLIVIDNGSHDGTVEWLKEQRDITLHLNLKNLGFTKGVNQGIALARPDEDVVCINNDIELADAGWLTELQRVAYAESDIGVVGSRLIDGNGLINHLGSYMQPVRLYGQQIGGLQTDINQAVGVRDAECVIFALAYITRACLEKVGVLDEELFAYFEDTDYCLRAWQAGLKVKYAGTVSPVHHHNTSTKENKVDFWSIYNKSRATFTGKWAGWLDHGRYDVEVNWNSVLHKPLGYALHSRQLMKALDAHGARVSYTNAYGEHDDPTGDLLVDDFALRTPGRDAVHVAYSQADYFKRVKGRHRVGYTMLEVTGLPQEWVDGCNAMDEVWVPATFNVTGFRDSGVTVPIEVMPLGIDTDYYHPGIAGSRPSDRFTMLSVFEWGERKAPEVLLRAWAQEFGEREDVLLLLSVFNRDPSVDVEREIKRLDLPRSAPIAVMVNPEFADYQMGALYRSADAFVLPTRGEGWGMPVMEAMACGLPTIATAWGGIADFLNSGNGYPLEYSMVPAVARCPFYEGFEWAEPSMEHLQARMREVVDNQDDARARASRAVAQIQQDYTWQAVTRRMHDRLREIGG